MWLEQQAESLHLGQKAGSTESVLYQYMGFETSKPVPSDIIPSVRSQPLKTSQIASKWVPGIQMPQSMLGGDGG